MKIRAMVLSFLIGVFILIMGYEYGWAESKSDKPSSKIGVVSVRRIFQDSKRNAKYREEAIVNQNRIIAELEKLRAEGEAADAGLKTLKTGSSDYMAQMKEVLTKQANLQAREGFYKQEIALKDQEWTEELYKEILQETDKVAEQKGLDLVLEKSEIELPALNANELMLAIRTHKLLYSAGCLDITDEVIARLDAKE
ncbi:MAG: OmpH/Skp family outer membrane protein [Planctomycetota bacterium]|jgi:Skp family chaperone for outer membrane proteins